MRKSIIDPGSSSQNSPGQSSPTPHGNWLNIDSLATVHITSEDPNFPIEHALASESSSGWRAAAKGPQFIRIHFDSPTTIRRIQLHFVEREAERSQEIAIYTASGGNSPHETLRQQFTFSPGGSTEEVEDYTVDLAAVTSLELRIDPDRAHDPTHSQHFATLQSLHLA